MRTAASAQVGTQRILYSAHAVKRFWERFMPDASYDEARQTLVDLSPKATITRKRPKGVMSSGLKHKWLTIGWLPLNYHGRIACFPLMESPDGLAAVTCIAPIRPPRGEVAGWLLARQNGAASEQEVGQAGLVLATDSEGSR